MSRLRLPFQGMAGLRRTALALLLAGCATTSAPSGTPEPDAGNASVPSSTDTDGGPLGDAGRGDAPMATIDAGFVSLFDGVDFAGWDRYLGIPNGESAPLGLENDPRGVFTIATVDGEPALHISGEVWGALVSKVEYGDFELRLEYKWGTKTWPPLNLLDSGVMVLSTGPYGAVNKGGNDLSDPIGSGAFMVSVEYQIATGNIGGLYNLGPIAKTDGPRNMIAEIPGAWNQVDIVVKGASSQHFLNGALVTSASGYELQWPGQPAVPLTRGKIQLQCEGGEIYFRRVEMRSLTP